MFKKFLILGILTVTAFWGGAGSAEAATQIKTVEFYVHQFAPNALTDTAATTITSGNGIKNTAWPASCEDANDASITINLPESGITVRKAWVEYFTAIEGVANSTNEMRFCRSGGGTITTSFTTVRGVDSAEWMPVELLQDVTSEIAAGSQTYSFNTRLTGSIRAGDSAKLYITYEYDDTSATQLKTVKYFVGSRATQAAAGTTDSFTVNPDIPESGVTVAQSFIEYWGQSAAADVGDGIVFAGFNGANPATAAGIDDVNVTSKEFRTLWNTSTTVNLNTDNTITLVNNNDEENLKSAEWNITYTYDNAASATQLRTIRYAMGQDIDTLNDAAQETLGTFAINLPDLATPSTNVRSAWMHYLVEPDAAANITPQVNITGAAAPSTGSAYAMAFVSNTGFTHALFDIKTFFNAEWANGDTLTAAGQCSVAGACDLASADFFVTYAYAVSQTTGIKTVTYFASQDIAQNTAGTAFTATTLSTFLPETGTKTFRNGGTRAVLLAGASTNVMVNTVTIDSAVAGTDTIAPSGTGNAEEHEHRVLLVSPAAGQLTNASQANISVSLNHTQAAHLSGAITFMSYEYPLPITAPPTVTTNFANPGATTATLYGTKTGGDDATQHGFAYGTNAALSGGDTATTTLGALTSNSSFYSGVGGLSVSTPYYFRAYGTSAGGTGYGVIRSFTTGNTAVTRTMRLFEGFIIKLLNGKVILY